MQPAHREGYESPSLTFSPLSGPHQHLTERESLNRAHMAGLIHGEKCDKFSPMTASVTDLRRKTTELLDEVKRGNDVEIEAHGKTVARLIPSEDRPAAVNPNWKAILADVLAGIRTRSEAATTDPEPDLIEQDRRNEV